MKIIKHKFWLISNFITTLKLKTSTVKGSSAQNVKMKIFVIHVIAGLTLLSGVNGEYTKYYRLDARILRNFSDVGEQTCCKECTAYTNCQSVNYNMLNHSCELNYEHVSGLTGKNGHQEYVYMDKAHCSSLFTSCPVSFWVSYYS